MDLIVTQASGRIPVTVLGIVGRVNLGNVNEMLQKAQSLYQEGARDLVIDLAGAESLTSAGLSAIITILRTFESGLPGGGAGKKSTHVKLANPSGQIRQMLSIAGFNSYLDIYDNLQDAVASF